jgi:hypothetical protein
MLTERNGRRLVQPQIVRRMEMTSHRISSSSERSTRAAVGQMKSEREPFPAYLRGTKLNARRLR